MAWGRCVEGESAPAFWPWRQVFRSLGIDPETIIDNEPESPDDRFRVFDVAAQAVLGAAGNDGLVVVLDDIQWADETSLLLLRHLADRIVGSRLLIFAALRHVGGPGAASRVLPDLLRSPGAERLDLQCFDLAEVRAQLEQLTSGELATDPGAILEVTSGNPFFVREVARSIVDGTWRPDRPPVTVVEIVRGRLDRVSVGCRRLVQAAAIKGRDFSVALVAAMLDEPVERCLPFIDEAIGYGLLDRVGDVGWYRFVHALTRAAVQATLTTAERAALHRRAAEATEAHFAADLSDHVADIAWHWAQLAPFGEAATARRWAVRAADDALRRLAYPDAARLFRAALSFDPTSLPDVERCGVLVALGRAAHMAGDVQGCVDAAVAAAQAARTAGRSELVSEAALVLEASPDSRVNAVAKSLCDEALMGLGAGGHEALRARLLAQRSHLAFYDGDHDRVESLSAAAVVVARGAGDDRALVDALHARKEAWPGPARRADRMVLATEMVALGQRTNHARTAMWGELWRIEGLIDGGELAAAAEALPALHVAVERIGGPVSAWQADRVGACIAQAQGRYVEAAALGRRAFERMRPVEPAPARGTYLALQCALACHVAVTDDALAFARLEFEPPPRFRTMARISRAFLLLRSGAAEEAAASYQQAGPVTSWSLPAFFVLPACVYGAVVAAELGRHGDLAVLLDHLRPFSGEHVSGEGVTYLGPVDLTLGRAAATLGELDDAIHYLAAAADQAGRAGASGFTAESNYHLAEALLNRDSPGDRDSGQLAAIDANRLAGALGMTAYVERTRMLVAQLGGPRPHPKLSTREAEVATLVAEGLTNRQIAQRLIISERTAENHVQHILTKLGFATRSQIATWRARGNS